LQQKKQQVRRVTQTMAFVFVWEAPGSVQVRPFCIMCVLVKGVEGDALCVGVWGGCLHSLGPSKTVESGSMQQGAAGTE